MRTQAEKAIVSSPVVTAPGSVTLLSPASRALDFISDRLPSTEVLGYYHSSATGTARSSPAPPALVESRARKQ